MGLLSPGNDFPVQRVLLEVPVIMSVEVLDEVVEMIWCRWTSIDSME